MKKLLLGLLCIAGLLLVTVNQTADYAYEVKPEITSIKPGSKFL